MNGFSVTHDFKTYNTFSEIYRCKSDTLQTENKSETRETKQYRVCTEAENREENEEEVYQVLACRGLETLSLADRGMLGNMGRGCGWVDGYRFDLAVAVE